jgi:hypothetical protein
MSERGQKGMIARWNWLNAFWLEKERGPYNEDFVDFCIQFGLTDRTARESYWDRAEVKGIIRVVYEKKLKFWEYYDSKVKPLTEEQTSLNVESATSFMDYAKGDKIRKGIARLKENPRNEIKEDMLATGLCNGNTCPSFSQDSCEHCSRYLNLIKKTAGWEK